MLGCKGHTDPSPAEDCSDTMTINTMALRNATTPANAQPLFETEDETTMTNENTTMTNEAPLQTAQVAAPSTSTAVAHAPSQGMSVAAIVKDGVLSVLKDAMHVEWDTVPRILATNGGFQFKESGEKLGDEIKLELHSYQTHWVCGPNDTSADFDLVKYSEDGTLARDGTNLHQHLQSLKSEGWVKASIQERYVIVGELVATSGKNPSAELETLVQIDLPPTGVSSFKNYMTQSSYRIGKGKKTVDEARLLTLKAVVAQNKAKQDYTKVVFAL